jgi:hypothetical protein
VIEGFDFCFFVSRQRRKKKNSPEGLQKKSLFSKNKPQRYGNAKTNNSTHTRQNNRPQNIFR